MSVCEEAPLVTQGPDAPPASLRESKNIDIKINFRKKKFYYIVMKI